MRPAGPAAGRTPITRSASWPTSSPGDAVIVEFGRRQALGVVVGDAAPEADPGVARPTKPLLARVRSDGPLLPALSVALARWIADHYLAPPSSVIRAMLPPGMLERLELVAEVAAVVRRQRSAPKGRAGGGARPSRTGPGSSIQLDRADGARRVSDLDAAEGRADLLRRLHRLADAGRLTLDWTLTTAGAGPRTDRLASADRGRPQPRRRPSRPVAGLTGPRLGPRQVALLAELAAADGPIRTPELAERHGDGTLRGPRPARPRRGRHDRRGAAAARGPGRRPARRPARRSDVHAAPGRGDRPRRGGRSRRAIRRRCSSTA